MTTRPTAPRRPGLTLVEALVALFVAAIGMISLLTLFPLAALQMGQAIKDERTSQAAMQADGLMRWYWREMLEKGPTTDPNLNPHSDPSWLDDPNSNVPATYQKTLTPPLPARVMRTQAEPSYPVFVDPIGFYSRGATAERYWVGNLAGLSRRSPAAVTNLTEAIRFCSLLDDLTYDDGGSAARPDPDNPNSFLPVERQGRYNWLAVVQRPDNTQRTSANLTIVVFDGRAPGYAPTGTELAYPRDAGLASVTAATDVKFLPGASTVRVYFTGNPPPISKGRWIMDGTIGGRDATGTYPGTNLALRHAAFYRVVSVTQDVDTNQTPNLDFLDLELQTPIRKRSDGSMGSYYGNLVVLTGASEVFERPQLTKPSSP